MSLLSYFSRVDSRYSSSNLPNPSGPLSREVPSKAIAAANEAIAKGAQKTTRGPYTKNLTASKKAEIGKRAAEHGVVATVRYYASRLPDSPLKESSVRTWRNAYIKEKQRLMKEGGQDTDVKKLPSKKLGRPYLLGEELEMQVRAYLTALRANGAVVNTAITIGCAEGIVRSKDETLLAANGGHISLTKSWGLHLLDRMGFVKRRASTKAKVSVENFESVKEQFLSDVNTIVEMEEIPHKLIINWDQTGIHYIPVSSWTMEKEGAKRVPIAAVDDKRQITAVFAGSLDGDFLPIQLIYKGTTPRCLPTVQFPKGWHATFSHNHWANEDTMKDYLSKILVPYVSFTRKSLKLRDNYPALVLFDHFSGQMTESVLEILDANHIHRVTIPANCTDRLQPLDVSVNKAAKEFLRRKFQDWYSRKICEQLKDSTGSVLPVDLKLSIVKPLGAKWMIELYDYLKTKPEIIVNGFKGAGIVACLASE